MGTQERRQELDDVRQMQTLLLEKGYTRGEELLFVVEMGGAHEERAWAQRMRRELHFLLGVPMPKGGLRTQPAEKTPPPVEEAAREG